MARTSKTSRLIALVAVLRQSRHPLTRRELFEAVPAYRNFSGKQASLIRTFERDKVELKEMGLALELIEDGEREEMVYRLPAPKDPALRCDRTERLSLAAAAQAVASLQGMPAKHLASTALAKLLEAPLGDVTDQAEDENLTKLMDWLSQSCSLRFAYRAAGRAQTREVVLDDPALTCRLGRWYLVGFDRERGEDRTFRLDRIHGEIEKCEAGVGRRRRAALDLWHLAGEEVLTVQLRATGISAPIPEGLMPQRQADGSTQIHCGNPRALIVWLCGQKAWRVESPKNLAQDIRDRLAGMS